MATFAQTDRDLTLQNGQLVLVTDEAEQAAIELTNKFLFMKGEFFLDTRQGVPYLDVVFVKNPNPVLIRQLFRNVILSVQTVKSITSLEVTVDRKTRKGKFSCRLVATNGKTIVGGSGQPFIVEAT